MLNIQIPKTTLWDEKNEEFVEVKAQTLTLEHSLISISKWESKWHKPYLHTKAKTFEESIDYIKCMTINKNVQSEVYLCLTIDNIKDIEEYIDNPMTATVFTETDKKTNREIITSEIIYYWMTESSVPVKFEKWHLNRLLTLLRVCAIRNSPTKKMGKQETIQRYAALNEARRKKYNTKG